MAVSIEDNRFTFTDPLAEVRDALAAVLRPTAQAHGLPNALYTEARLFAEERDRVMARSWVCIGFASDLYGNGYALPVELMGLPLVIFRNRCGDIKVFHNVCSHRGMMLVQAESVVQGVVRCPYHSWTYDLDGGLRGTPHFGGVGCHEVDGFAREGHGLRRVRSAVWMDMIFVNLAGDAGPLEDHIAPLAQRWAPLLGDDGLDLLRRVNMGGSLEMTVTCNWKLAVENYCEAYHLPWVHPSLNSYSRLEDHYGIDDGIAFAGQGSNAYNLADVAGTQLPKFPSWPESKRRQAEYVALYPNVLLGVQADHVFALRLDPVAHDRTVEHLRVYYVGDAAAGDEYAANRTATLEAWRTVFSEDIAAVEGLQRGRASPAFRGGVFSPAMDTPTHHFHRWVAAMLGDPEVGTRGDGAS